MKDMYSKQKSAITCLIAALLCFAEGIRCIAIYHSMDVPYLSWAETALALGAVVYYTKNKASMMLRWADATTTSLKAIYLGSRLCPIIFFILLWIRFQLQ